MFSPSDSITKRMARLVILTHAVPTVARTRGSATSAAAISAMPIHFACGWRRSAAAMSGTQHRREYRLRRLVEGMLGLQQPQALAELLHDVGPDVAHAGDDVGKQRAQHDALREVEAEVQVALDDLA